MWLTRGEVCLLKFTDEPPEINTSSYPPCTGHSDDHVYFSNVCFQRCVPFARHSPLRLRRKSQPWLCLRTGVFIRALSLDCSSFNTQIHFSGCHGNESAGLTGLDQCWCGDDENEDIGWKWLCEDWARTVVRLPTGSDLIHTENWIISKFTTLNQSGDLWCDNSSITSGKCLLRNIVWHVWQILQAAGDVWDVSASLRETIKQHNLNV